MVKFSTITKIDEWDSNPTLEEMVNNYNRVKKLDRTQQSLKIGYGFNEGKEIEKIVIVSDSKLYTKAIEFVRQDCTEIEPLQPIFSMKKVINEIKKIIKIAENKEDKNMENKKVKEVEEKQQEVAEGEVVSIVPVEKKATAEQGADGSAGTDGVEVSDDVLEKISKLFDTPAGDEQSVDAKAITDEQETMKNSNEVKNEGFENQIPGVKILDECSAEVATDSLWGNKLHIRALLSKETNKRKYQIFEVDQTGKELGTISCESLFRASEVLNGTSSKIKHFIQDLDGNYNGQIADILSRMTMIEKRRILSPAETLDIDGCKTVEEFWKRLQDWFESHLDDIRVGVVDIKGRTHVALVKRGRTCLNDIFKSVCMEIAPKMKSSLIKGELYRRELLIHDYNTICKDTQLTVGAMVQLELGIVNDKIMSFAFEEEVIRNMKVGYEIYRMDGEE